ncbi:MAG: 16S rRNA (guanine(527)-N(7))-methyltransferase RsmG [Candidatus Sericytochromatia bacterium]|nr:16S rRNA (guanine(527)-N(7))-methyltransferase RsmG [Candidatus Tanganyikabacteria bacterium]
MTPWELLSEGAKAYGATLSADQVSAFRRYYDLLVEWNQRINLTRITGERDAVLKHFLDSLAYLVGIPASWHDRPTRLLDVGAGAGFPGIPLLLARPKWTGVLLEATRKKANFLDEAIRELGLSLRAQAHWGRAEEASKSGKGRYDLVTARAVADVATIVDWTLEYLRPGGRLLISKGPKGREEAANAAAAIRRAGGREPELMALDLPEGAGTRILVVVAKAVTGG